MKGYLHVRAGRLFEATAHGDGGERLYCLRRSLANLALPPYGTTVAA